MKLSRKINFTLLLAMFGAFLGAAIKFPALITGGIPGLVLGALAGAALDLLAHRYPGGWLAEFKSLGRRAK